MFIVIWKGWGLMVILIVVACVVTTVPASNYLSGQRNYAELHHWVFAAALIFSAIPIYVIGRQLNSTTGVNFRCQHTLYYIPFQNWAFIMGLCGIATLVFSGDIPAIGVNTNASSLLKAIDKPTAARSENVVPTPPESPAPILSAEVTPAPPKWLPPVVVPSHPDWTWITPDRIYHNVRIIKIEANQVSVVSDEGTVTIPTWTLPTDIQAQLNYRRTQQ